MSRRAVVKAGALSFAVPGIGLIDQLAITPVRQVLAATAPPDIQFDIGNFIAPAQNINGIPFRFGPVFTGFATLRLNRTPSRNDQAVLSNALNTIEAVFPFSPSGVFTFVAYGIPYFNRLPSALVTSRVPRLRSNTARFVLEEAVPSPTDVSSQNPGITKKTFNVPVAIERNDVLMTFRSDSTDILNNILNWLFSGTNNLGGNLIASPAFNGLFTLQTARLMFQQQGLPRQVANQNALPYAARIRDTSPMWMGFADQQVDAAGPAAITTFVGNASARVTTAVAGDYFDNGSIQHLSHVILDMAQWLATPAQDPPDGEPYTERVQYMFRSNQKNTADGLPNDGFTDQFTNGGGPGFLTNVFQGTGDASANAQAIGTFNGEHRMGHEAALQRSSRAADGTPMHIRMDGPGFNTMDVPGGSNQPKLQFTVFVPSAEFFRVMRVNQASLDLTNQFGVLQADNGLERFMTTTRRQNFLVPPRRHRAFPLVELT
ncbi:MAG TPA: hypothetical protein VIC57_15095 [Candidatus Dormibacteraeota bacterium]